MHSNPFKLDIGSRVIIDYRDSLHSGIIEGILPATKEFYIRLDQEGDIEVIVGIDKCIPCSLSSYILYSNGPISNFFKILETGYVVKRI